MRRILLCLLLRLLILPIVAFAAKTERNWQSGKVTDSLWSGTEGPTEVGGAHASKLHHMDFDAHILTIQTGEAVYTVREKRAWHSWCLLIPGDEIQLSKEDHQMMMRDWAGSHCKFDILREEKR